MVLVFRSLGVQGGVFMFPPPFFEGQDEDVAGPVVIVFKGVSLLEVVVTCELLFTLNMLLEFVFADFLFL